MSPLEIARQDVAKHLDRIKLNFKNPKVTLLVRAPSHPDGSADFVMTDDDPAAAIEALQRRFAQGADA